MASEFKLPDGNLAKVDSMGRVRTTRQQRESILAEFDRSGISGTRFAELHGIKYLTFVGWLQDRKRWQTPVKESRSSSPALPAKLELREVVLDQHPRSPTTGLEIHLPGGASLKIANPQQARLAAELIRALT